jgi:hyperosmotically inducible periplasmic protein
MIRTLLRLIIVIIVLVGVGGFLLGWWGAGRATLPNRNVVGTTGVDTQRAREVGAQVGEKTAEVANQAKTALDDGALTAKIKSKMALDDTVKALDINVDTANGIVTLSGTVRSEAERQRALRLAKETNGVREVVDRLVIR